MESKFDFLSTNRSSRLNCGGRHFIDSRMQWPHLTGRIIVHVQNATGSPHKVGDKKICSTNQHATTIKISKSNQ